MEGFVALLVGRDLIVRGREAEGGGEEAYAYECRCGILATCTSTKLGAVEENARAASTVAIVRCVAAAWRPLIDAWPWVRTRTYRRTVSVCAWWWDSVSS